MDIRNLLNPATEHSYQRDINSQNLPSAERTTPPSKDTPSPSTACSPKHQQCTITDSHRETMHKAKRQFENLFQEYKAKVKRKLADLRT
ncbi:hypothetical protein H4R35_005971, partial [Dimargaris xerosporica]